MRNYIILNGTNSNTITGLLIQELAPISKPLMRTEIEEIDGRDGDIITPLGFSAYDKEITIGLYGSFDINEVIAFFNSEGTVIFSNEPDKYYNYTIYQQIDFERLVRFKTATVTLHCQPFKYGTTGESQSFGDGSTVSGTGSNIVLENSTLAPFNKLDLKGNTVQNGTPTPSAPVAVQTVTGENTVQICGKNLAPITNGTTTIQQLTASVDNDGVITINGSAANSCYLKITNGADSVQGTAIKSSWASENVVNDVSGKILSIRYISGSCPSAGTAWRLFDGANQIAQYYPATSDIEAAYTTSGGVSCITLFVGANRAYDNYKVQVQLELGSTATAYEPYQGQSYPISLGSIELCKIGDYQDYIWKDGDTWKIHKEVGKVVLNGTTTPFTNQFTAANSKYRFTYDDSSIPNYSSGTTASLYCDRLTGGTIGNTWNNIERIAYNDAGNRFIMYIGAISSSSLADANTWLTSNNVTIYYILATPTDTAITNDGLISQLNDIASQAHAYKTRTHIVASAATGNAPHIIDAEVVTASADGTITNAGNIYSKPKLTIYGSGDIGVYLDGVQMFQIALGTLGHITIDTNLMEAYTDTTDNLQNRAVTGDYNNFKLPVGNSKLSFSGIVTSCTVENYSRWL